MALDEILNRSFTPYPVRDEDAESAAKQIVDGSVLVSPSEGGRYSIWKNNRDIYFVKVGEKVAGWIILKPYTLPNEQKTLALDLIYFMPEFRGTKALAILLHGVRTDVSHPILVPASAAIFKGGAELLGALAKRKQVSLSAVSKNGHIRPVIDFTDLNRDEGLLIEDVPPLWQPLSGLLGKPTDKKLVFAWYDNDDSII